MKGRVAALLFCVLLIIQMGIPPGKAQDTVYFVAAGESILPLSDSTMPFWHDGYLYISSSIFTGTVRESLNVSHNRNTEKKVVILYQGGESLLFEVGNAYATDRNDNRIVPGAVERNGNVFVPAAAVANFFGLQYSVSVVSKGYLIWLRRPGSVQLSERVFVDAASHAMLERYAEYKKVQEPTATPSVPTVPSPPVTSTPSTPSSPTPSITPSTPSTPSVAVPEPSAPEDSEPDVETEEQEIPVVEEEKPKNTPDIEGKTLYLCMRAGEDTASLLDTLDRYGMQAAFFCEVAFLEEQGDLLRRMVTTGQSIGILVNASDRERSVTEQLEAGNAALERATCGRTRLTMIERGTSRDRRNAEKEGYRCLQATLNRAQYDLANTDNANTLLKRVAAKRGDVSVWLADSVRVAGLRALLNTVKQGGARCLGWTETA